jgi:molecular chaperone Hsp33
VDDFAQPFHFEHLPIRGVHVRLAGTWAQVLARHRYPPALHPLLGEALAACALLTATLKAPARLTFEVRTPGPLRYVVADAWEGARLRALARWEEPLPDSADAADLLASAQLLITLEARAGTPRYQGVVDVRGGSITAALETYFAQSEQLPTQVRVKPEGDAVVGVLLQRLPGADGPAALAAWEVRAAALAATGALRETDTAALLHRLYRADDLRLPARRPLAFGCSCSPARVEDMLRALGREEIASLLAERGEVDVDCEFCGAHYGYDATAAAALFDEAAPRPH